MNIRLCLLILLLLPLLPLHAAPETPPVLGKSLAGIQLYDLHGKRHSLDAVKTPRVVVIFWAFWCDTWKKALPAVRDLATEQEALGFVLWTVSVDGRYTAEIRPQVERGAISFPVLLDDRTWSDRLGIRRVPTVLVLDEKRRVIWAKEAYPGNPAIVQALGRKSER